MPWSSRRRVLLWDSNPFNTYGAEVARVLRDSDFVCVRVCRTGAVYSSRYDQPRLPPARDGQRSLRHRMRYLAALVTTTAWVVAKRPLVVVPWLNTRYEMVMVRAWQSLGVRVITVNHDPIPSRSSGTDSALEKSVRAKSTLTVVHSPEHLPLTEDPLRSRTVTHPAYFDWARRHVHSSAESSRRTALWFGAARSDKGFEHLRALGRALLAHKIDLVAAPGVLTEEQRTWLLEPSPNLTVIHDGGYVTEATLGSLLSRADLLVAPYRDVTASGTILMALSAGLPVAAFDEPALRGLLPASCMATPQDVEALATACAHTAVALPPPGSIASHQDELARDSWRAVVEEVLR